MVIKLDYKDAGRYPFHKLCHAERIGGVAVVLVLGDASVWISDTIGIRDPQQGTLRHCQSGLSFECRLRIALT